MIHLKLVGKRIEVQAPFQHREAIKALGAYPDVKWNAERKVWSIDARLYDKLARSMGQEFAPLTYDFFCGLPAPEIRTGYYAAMKRNAEAAERDRKQRFSRKAQVWQ